MPPDRYTRRLTSRTGPQDNRPLPGWFVLDGAREDAEPPKPKGGWANPAPQSEPEAKPAAEALGAVVIGAWAGANPRAALGVICLALWALGFWWLGALLGLFVLFGPFLWDAAVEWWWDLPASARLAVVGATAGLAILLAIVWWLAAAAVAAVAVVRGPAAVRAWRWRRDYLPHYRRHVAPLHDALAPVFGIDPRDLPPAAWLDVPVGLLEGDGAITIGLPTAQVPSEARKEEVLRVAATKLGLSDYRYEWRLDGENRHLHISAAAPKARVPEVVPFDDEFRGQLRRTSDDKWLVGRTLNGRPYYLDPTQENPHALFSCLTGWGKSNAVGVIVADHLHDGGEALILDAKYGSMPWAADLPGVTYARTVREIHDALIRVGAESERRRRTLADAPWDKRPKFPRLLIVIEETNTTIDELTAFWVEERALRLKQEAKDNGDRIDLPTKSPALRFYRQAGFMGRELCMNLLVISQRAESNDVGGSAIRNQLGTKVLGWPSPADWGMHAKSHPFQQSTGKPGHAFIVRVNKVDEVQFAYAPPADLRDWATSGRRPVATLAFPSSYANGHGSRPGASTVAFLGTAGGADVPEDPDGSPITLRQAVDEGVVQMSLPSLQRYSRPSMTVGFPQPVGQNGRSAKLYDRDALRSWGEMWRNDEVGVVEE